MERDDVGGGEEGVFFEEGDVGFRGAWGSGEGDGVHAEGAGDGGGAAADGAEADDAHGEAGEFG